MSLLKQCRACALCDDVARECQYYVQSNEVCQHYVMPFNSSKGMFSNVFSTKGRVRRLEYNIMLVVLFLGWILCGQLAIQIGIIWIVYIYLVVAAILWFLCFVKRMHDIDANMDDIFSPANMMAIKAVFTKGTEGPNKYGTDPKLTYDEQIMKDWS